MSKHKHVSEAESNPAVSEPTVELSRREIRAKEKEDKQKAIDEHREAVRKEMAEKEESETKAKEEAYKAEVEKNKGKRLTGFTQLNPGQRITARGRIIAGMSVEDAVVFATKPKPQGRSAAALALRAKHPKKFAKLDKSGNAVPPSAAKLAYLKSIEEKKAL